MNKHVEFLCGLFIDGDIERVIKEYDLQGNHYKYEDYIDIGCVLHEKGELFAGDPRRQFIRELFDKIMGVCSAGVQNIENREELISAFRDFLISVKNRCCQMGYSRRDNARIRDVALKFLMNIVCACSNNEYKIQYLALIYDMVQRWSKEDAFFNEFYGEGAKECIVVNTLEILNRTKITKRYIDDILRKEDRNYVKNFCRVVLDYWYKNRKILENNCTERLESRSSNASESKPAHTQIRVRDVIYIIIIFLLAYMLFNGSYAKIIRNKKSNEIVIEEMKNDINKLTNQIKNMNDKLESQAEQLDEEKDKVDEKFQKVEQKLEKLKQEQPVADIENSEQEQPVAGIENSEQEQPVAGIENLEQEQPVAGIENSEGEVSQSQE